MIKTKFSQAEKPRSVNIDHINDDLGSNYYSLDKLKFLNGDGKVVARYKNTGSFVVGSVLEKEVKTIKNTGNVAALEFDHPFLISVHDNDVLQLTNIETGQLDKSTGEKDILKKVQCILTFDNLIFLVSPTTVFVYDKNNISAPKKVVPLQDAKDDKTRPIINIKQNFSQALSTSQLLLGNADVFQAWTISPDKNEMTMTFEGRNVNSQIKYFGVFVCSNTVVTINRENFSVWDLTKPTEAAKNPRELKAAGMITTVTMDDSFMILGLHNGLVELHQRGDGEKLYDLNVADPHASQPKKDEGSLLDYNFESKINRIEKLGRWVFCSTENSKVSVYDITEEKGDPVFIYTHKTGAVRDLLVDKSLVLIGVKTDKEKDTKPEVLSWNPKVLPGYEYYNLKKMSLGRQIDGTSLTSILSFSHYQISEYLSSISKAGEDITEFSSNIARVEQVVAHILKNPDFNISFKTLKNLHKILDEYINLLEKLTASGRLVRFFTSSRLRRGLEMQNSHLHGTLNEVEEVLRVMIIEKQKRLGPQQPPTGPQSPPPDKTLLRATSYASVSTFPQPSYEAMKYVTNAELQQSQSSFQPAYQKLSYDEASNRGRGGTGGALLAPEIQINDVAGKDWWKKNFGHVLMVDYPKFATLLQSTFPSILAQDAATLKDILDHGYTGFISQYRFNEFLKGFGPFDKCVDNVRVILKEKWFHGFLSSRESELLMKVSNSPDGTFLVRFSKSKPGSFALAFMKSGNCRHILIESNMPVGLSVSEQEGSGSTRVFKSLHDIVKHYNFVLKHPYVGTISRQDWFHGDVNAEESNELLEGQPAGTFLVRFSSKGTFAASFIDSKAQIRHVLITNRGKDAYEVNTGETETMIFASIELLVKYYMDKGVFKFALKTENQKN